MDEKDFLDLIKDTKLSKASREAARLVFINGMSQVEAGNEVGLSKQRMHAIIGTVRRIEQERKQPPGSNLIAVLEASYAVAVKIVRDQLGDQIKISTPSSELSKTVGQVLVRTDFHLVQSLGRNEVIIHDLAKLDKVPQVGKTVEIQYEHNRGMVSDKGREKQHSGHTR